MRSLRIAILAALGQASPAACPAAEGIDAERARAALRTAVGFFTAEAAKHGGYVWRYSADFKLSEGEAETGADTVWVQPPGTPSVGMALLEAYRATGEKGYLDHARGAAMALVAGQLQSGGWYYRIEFGPAGRAKWGYRDNAAFRASPTKKNRTNITTLDDDTTQSALRFLCELDRELEFKDAPVHDAARFGLDALLAAQRASGGWSQSWHRYPDFEYRDEFPMLPASYPEQWSRRWLNDWPGRYYLNDNVVENTVDTLLLAAEVYGDDRYLDAARRAGEFLIRAQMPDPQPAWAQQYDAEMHPCWDRKFEPPAISSAESESAMRALLAIFRATGERRFLEPLAPALKWLKKSRLPGGKVARFYELRTNKPLYFKVVDGVYQLTYDDSALPTHYGFIIATDLAELSEAHAKCEAGDRTVPADDASLKTLGRRAAAAVAALDERGGWMSARGMRGFAKASPEGVYESAEFIDRVDDLCAFLKAQSAGAARR